jgi:hypothetical protein
VPSGESIIGFPFAIWSNNVGGKRLAWSNNAGGKRLARLNGNGLMMYLGE